MFDKVLEGVLGSAAGKDVADATRLPVLKHEVKKIFNDLKSAGVKLDEPDLYSTLVTSEVMPVLRGAFRGRRIYVPGLPIPTLDEELRKRGIQLEINGLEDFKNLILASIEVFKERKIPEEEIERATKQAIQQGLTPQFFSK